MPVTPHTLHALVVNLSAQNAGVLPGSLGELGHAAFYAAIQAVDPALSARMHEADERKAETTECRYACNPCARAAAFGDLRDERYSGQKSPYEPTESVRLDFAPQDAAYIKHITEQPERDGETAEDFLRSKYRVHAIFVPLSHQFPVLHRAEATGHRRLFLREAGG